MNLLVHSYNELEIYDLAYDSARVLLKNYPEYKLVSSNNNQPAIVKKIMEDHKGSLNLESLEKQNGAMATISFSGKK